jgi:CMP/dCMP kinase
MAVIRVSGYHGSGKTTLCLRLAKVLGYSYFYTGSVFREMAAKRGLSIEAYYKEIAGQPELEKEIDGRGAQLMAANDNLIVEGRMAPFQPTPFKAINILLTVSEEAGARRQRGRTENAHLPQAEMLALSRERLREEQAHYQKLYAIENHFDPKYFDIVLDTTTLSNEEAFDEALGKIQQFLK